MKIYLRIRLYNKKWINHFFFFIAFIILFNPGLNAQKAKGCSADHCSAGSGAHFTSSQSSCSFFLGSFNETSCDDFTRFSTTSSSFMPQKTVRLLFHIFQKDDGTGNFQDTPADRGIIESLVAAANNTYANVWQQSPAGDCSAPHIPDTRIQFEIVDMLFYQDDIAWSSGGFSDPYGGCEIYNDYVTNNSSLTQDLKEKTLHVFVFYTGRNSQGIPQTNPPIGGWASGIPANIEKFISMKGWYYKLVESAESIWGYPTFNFCHELGHTLGLYHANSFDYCCDTPSGNSNNFMANTTQGALTPCQIARMHYILEGMTTSDMYKVVRDGLCCGAELPDILIPAGTTEVWDYDRHVDRNIIVETGGQLIITCTVRMGSNKHISVKRGGKLTVDGGTITNLCDLTWEGIFVEGNYHKIQPDPNAALVADDAGVAIFRNNAIIENASSASVNARAYFDTYPVWEDERDHWGGVIYAINSTFRNNKAGFSFMKYPMTNKSQFINCHFVEEGNTVNESHGGIIWACTGLIFDDNRFENIDNAGLHGVDYGAIIRNGNDFLNCDRGIEAFSTSPAEMTLLVDGSVEPNRFENNDIHIYVSGSDLQTGIQVFSNEFSDARIGIRLDGDTKYYINNNIFNYQETSIDSWQSGFQHNYIVSNLFQFVETGIIYQGINDQSQFIDNCFLDVSNTDVWITEKDGDKGNIALNVGHSGNPAGNCFYENSSDIIAHPNEADFFRYYEPFFHGQVNLCLFPNDNLSDGGINNYQTPQTSGPVSPCGEGGGEHPEDPEFPGEDELGLIALEGAGFELETQLQEALKNNNYEKAEKLLIEQKSDHAQRILYTVYLIQENFAKAKQQLNKLSDGQQLFITIQTINLQRLQNPADFALSEVQEQALLSIAESNSRERSHARALLALLKNRQFEVRSAQPQLLNNYDLHTTTNKQMAYQLFPNPSSSEMTLNYPTKTEQSIYLDLIGVDGKVIYSGLELDNSGQFLLDSNEIGKGVFFVRLYNEQASLFSDRILFVR